MVYVKKYILEQAKNKKIAIFGTGEKALIAVNFLSGIGISEYIFFDNDTEKIGKIIYEKKVLNPSTVTTEYFILISTVYFKDIERQLNSQGLKELQDYIYILELDYYNALIQWINEPRVPELSFYDLNMIEKKLKQYVDVKKADWFDEQEFKIYEKNLKFQKFYDKQYNKRYRRKIMEYYCVEKILHFDNWKKSDIYIDIGAAGSPFSKYLRENKNIMAYAIDLQKSNYNELPYYLQEDATKTHFKDEEITAISMQSSFEMFAGNTDIALLEEMSRILKRGGKAIICPLYLHKQYLSTVSPNYYGNGFADKNSLECIRVDCRGNIQFARFYNINSFNVRILEKAKCFSLNPYIYSLPEEKTEKDGFVYLKFILVLEKSMENFYDK